MKARKVKKEHGKVLAELEEKMALQERALTLQTRQAAEYREKSLKLIHELLRGLEAINENNYRFLTDILSERIRAFLSEEEESLRSDTESDTKPALQSAAKSAIKSAIKSD